MFMKISWGRIRADKWDEFEATYKRVVAQPVAGLKGRWLAQDTEDRDAGHSITLWDSLGALRAYEASDLFSQVIDPACKPFYVGEFTTHISEIVMQTSNE